MSGAPAAPVWGVRTPQFFPNSQEGHSLSCYGFCSLILGLFAVVCAKLPSCHSASILSAAKSHAGLGTKGWGHSAAWMLVHGCTSTSLPPTLPALPRRVSHTVLASLVRRISQLMPCAC